MTQQGRKFDGGKLEYGLLPPKALEATVAVLTFGAQKYERGNWKFVPESKRRYFDAMQRHIWAWKYGGKNGKNGGKNGKNGKNGKYGGKNGGKNGKNGGKTLS